MKGSTRPWLVETRPAIRLFSRTWTVSDSNLYSSKLLQIKTHIYTWREWKHYYNTPAAIFVLIDQKRYNRTQKMAKKCLESKNANLLELSRKPPVKWLLSLATPNLFSTIPIPGEYPAGFSAAPNENSSLSTQRTGFGTEDQWKLWLSSKWQATRGDTHVCVLVHTKKRLYICTYARTAKWP